MRYGILAVTVSADLPFGFDRHWVKVRKGKPALWDTMTEAQTMADKMTEAAREANIPGVGYRAKQFTLKD